MQSDILDVVIGVVFAWLLLSIVLSALHEGFALVTHARAKNLWLGVGRLVHPSSALLPRRLTDVVWTLPFGASLDLRPRTHDDTAADAAAEGGADRRFSAGWWTQRPAAMTRDDAEKRRARELNQQLYDALAPTVTELAKPGRLSKVTHLPATVVSAAVLAAGRVHRADLVQAARTLGWTAEQQEWLRSRLVDVDDDQHLDVTTVSQLAERPGPSRKQLEQLYQTATRMFAARDAMRMFRDNPALVRAIREAELVADLDERVAAIRGVIEHYFDRQMEQLSRLYRRQSRKILLLLAIPVVLFTHSNAIDLYQNLREDAALRQATAGAAVAGLAIEIDDVCRTSGGDAAEDDTPSTTIDPIDAATQQLRCARDIVEDANEFRIGLAWGDLVSAGSSDDRQLGFDDIGPYLRDTLADDWGFLGRAITLVALLFGAQFWFDALRRLVGLRRTLTGTGHGAGAT